MNNIKTKINNKTLLMIIVLTIVLSLAVGYATFQSELIISSSAYVNPNANNFKVVFSARSDKLDSSAITPTTSNGVEASTAVINTNNLSIKRMNVTFTEPGQKASYNLYVLNQGDYIAFLNKIEFENYESYSSFKKCTAIDTSKQSQVDEACKYIKVALKINDTNTYDTTSDIQNHTLEQNQFDAVTIDITFEDNNVDLDTDFTVDFGVIALIYSTVGDYNPDNDPTSSSKNNSASLVNQMLMNEAKSDSIKKSRVYVQNKVTPNFGINATTDEGLFSTVDEDGIVYYYRGAVDDNHVIFAGFCWRIVRTTGTGGVKILYDGVPNNGECNNTGRDTIIDSSNNQFNSKYNSPAYVGYMYGITSTSYSKDIRSLTGSIVFGNDVTYDASKNIYTLKDTYTIENPSNWDSEYTNVLKKHYTCFTSSDTCQVVNYVNVIYSQDKNCYYIALTDGKNHLDILKETLTNSSNATNSTVKSQLDIWFSANLTEFQQYLEDTIFCNDRTYYNLETSGWNKDYSNYDNWLMFSSYGRMVSRTPSLICSRKNDKFTVNLSKGNGDLTYPIGLITADEIALAGGVVWLENTSYYLYNSVDTWSISPAGFLQWTAVGLRLASFGHFGYHDVMSSLGIRPLISLKPGIQIVSGNGSKTNPYKIN